jgi:aquaporin Z
MKTDEQDSPGNWNKHSPLESLQRHWPEYFMEAAQLGIFMISAGVFTVLLEYPGSCLHQFIVSPTLRRAVIGLAMGGTAMALIYSPWGKRSGAHMNPAITLTFLQLGKIPLWDACFYLLFQCAGGLSGVILTALVLRRSFVTSPVNYVVTVPGPSGELTAFLGELVIAIVLMTMILYVSNRPSLSHLTGLFAGILIASFVTFEAPLSGFGMNPARTFASALPSGIWTAFWIYLLVPPSGMLFVAEGFRAFAGSGYVRCCKLHHDNGRACIFCGRRSAFGTATDERVPIVADC